MSNQYLQTEDNRTSMKVEREGLSWFACVGLAILLICYLGAIWNVIKVVSVEKFSGKKILRICHWQLESGVTAALDEMIKRFESENPDVHVEQIPISERAYSQWVTTQLIGRTAPDIIEVGMFDTRNYLRRYFMPISEIILKPNPYNKDNEFKDTPWKDTFLDGMQSSYRIELVDYYSVPLSQFTIRLFYNKDIFRDILGKDSPPATLQELEEDCSRIQEYVDAYNRAVDEWNKSHKSAKTRKDKMTLSPIASSSYQVAILKTKYASSVTADKVIELDRDFDGEALDYETIVSLFEGKLSFDDEKYRASREIVKDLAKYFPRGFMSVDRMDAGFSFVQGRAAMITSGSWDANSFIKQVSEQPFGDIILEVDGKEARSSEDAARLLIEGAKSKKPVSVKINREGREKTLVLKDTQEESGDILKVFGLGLKDFDDGHGKKAPVVTYVESASPASRAGFKKRMRFEIGIFDFPMPKDHPKYGRFYVGKIAENIALGFPFGITKFSKNQELAIKFLQFCTTPENNQELNRIAQWIPSVKGAEPSGFLKAFMPDYRGYWGFLKFGGGSRVDMKETQVYWPYISGEPGYDYDRYISILKETLPSESAYDFDRDMNTMEETIPIKNMIRSASMANYFLDRAKDPEHNERNRRRLAASWDVLAYDALRPSLVKALVYPVLKREPQNEFHRKFMDTYKTLKRE